MEITRETKLRDIYEIECLKDLAPYFWGQTDPDYLEQMMDVDWNYIENMSPTWKFEDFYYGICHLINLAEKQNLLFSIYSDDEIKKDSYKEVVHLIYMPAEKQRSKKYVLLCAGGAYTNVCTVGEAVPVATRLNELGYTVFCLNYRTYKPEFEENGLMPLPLEDVAAALRFIDLHAEEFGVEAGRYAMGGFSAGGHLTSMWGTTKGYEKYGQNRPEVLFLNYPLVTVKNIKEETQIKQFMKWLMGSGMQDDQAKEYLAAENLNVKYPPCYIVQCEDDDMVPYYNAVVLNERLEQIGIKHELYHGLHGGHGYGRGSKTDVAGWIDKAVEFWEKEIAK